MSPVAVAFPDEGSPSFPLTHWSLVIQAGSPASAQARAAQ